ncbi:MAG: hypothetical protein J5861_00330, partial [Desulfovibrio sp.]|nr:hypothetical protein [Desulfovibrio sp.]
DTIDGGAGNDIIVYDAADAIDGGEGVDILTGTGSVEALLQASSENASNVSNVEVAVNTVEVTEDTSLTNMQDALKDSGITVTTDEDTQETVVTVDESKLTMNTDYTDTIDSDSAEVTKVVIENGSV